MGHSDYSVRSTTYSGHPTGGSTTIVGPAGYNRPSGGSTPYYSYGHDGEAAIYSSGGYSGLGYYGELATASCSSTDGTYSGTNFRDYSTTGR